MDAINDVKKSILKKKVLLNIIIESYSWYDRIFRYIHIGFALTAPSISFIDQLVTGNVEATSTATLVIGSVVAGMIKLKDYLKFDKLKDQAKHQTVKYHQLYQRIEKEMRKPHTTKEAEEEFISWINRELVIIESDDPDIPQSLKQKYIELCKAKGIPYDEDLDELTKLFNIRIEMPPENIERKLSGSMASQPTNQADVQTVSHPAMRQSESQTTSQPTTHSVPHSTQLRQTAAQLKTEREAYREQVKTLDTGKDLDWAIERLNAL